MCVFHLDLDQGYIKINAIQILYIYILIETFGEKQSKSILVIICSPVLIRTIFHNHLLIRNETRGHSPAQQRVNLSDNKRISLISAMLRRTLYLVSDY